MISPKQITLMTYGSRGDVEPFIALALGLQKAGHSVQLVGPAPFSSFVQSHGIEFIPVEGNPEELAQAFADRAGLNSLSMIFHMTKHVFPIARKAFQTILAKIQKTDLVIHTFLLTYAGHTLARLRGVPDVSAQFFPVFLPTAAFTAVAQPDLPLGGAYRRATHAFNTAVFRHSGRVLYRFLRASDKELPALGPWPFRKLDSESTPILFGYSPQVLPLPSDWPTYAHVAGYWRLPIPADWNPPEELVSFLDSSSPLVYFGPGSMRSEMLTKLLKMFIASARSRGARMLLGVSPQAVPDELKGTDISCVEGIPHTWLFPQTSFIFHHGGAGTVGAALTAGIPNTAIPFSTDQAFWARQVHRLGVGPAGCPARQLTRERLDSILEDGLANPTYVRSAQVLAQKIQQEDGVLTAIELIHARLENWNGWAP